MGRCITHSGRTHYITHHCTHPDDAGFRKGRLGKEFGGRDAASSVAASLLLMKRGGASWLPLLAQYDKK